jgi:hypothetical protein
MALLSHLNALSHLECEKPAIPIQGLMQHLE